MKARNQSYVEGKTTDTQHTDDDGLELHERGIKAEYALALCYDEAEVDRSISENGDDGVDAQIEIDGELVDVDVKATQYKNAWLLVKQGYDHEEAEVFISAYVDGSTVEFVGPMWADEVLKKSNLEESPSPYHSHENYTVKDESRYEGLPFPDGDSTRVSW